MEASTRDRRMSAWVTFAGVMFVIAAAANIIWGIAALDGKEYLPESSLLFGTLTFWGWVSVLWGLLLALGSYLLLSGSRSGGGVGVLLAMISAIFWLFALPLLPIFSMTMIIVDALIIYGLVMHGGD